MATADELYLEAKCFLCYGMTQAQALKLALLRRKALELDPDADVTPETLLLNASCYNCYANGSIYDLLELALLAIIAGTPCPPAGNVDGLIWGPNPETVDSIVGSFDALTIFTNGFFPTSAYTEFSFGNPTTVTNGIDFSTNTVTTSLTFRLLESVGTDFNVDTNVLTLFSAPLLQTVGSGLFFSNSTSLTSVSFPSLQSVGTDVSFATNVLTSFSAPLLQTIGDELDFSVSAALTNLTLPSLTSVGTIIYVDGGVIEVLNLPLLAAYPTLAIQADASLQTLNIPSCVDDGAGQLNADLVAMTGLVTLNVNSIVTISTPTLSGSAGLTSFVAGAWIPTDGETYDFTGCSLDIPSVENILRRGIVGAVTTSTFNLSGGTNAGLASLSAQAQQDAADLVTAGNTVNINP